jgi:hypothetical protein
VRSGLPQPAQVDAAEGVECLPLHPGAEQGLVGVLAVEVDEPVAQLGELAHGRQPAVHVGP